MIRRMLVALLAVFTFVSCSTDDDSIVRELAKNRQLWEASNIENYAWSERLSCFCGGVLERDIFVVNGVKDYIEFDESTLPNGQTYNDVFNATKTVEEAFDFIESLLSQELASLVIEYDATYGFPTRISIDYIENAVDDEIGYIYTDFNIEN